MRCVWGIGTLSARFIFPFFFCVCLLRNKGKRNDPATTTPRHPIFYSHFNGAEIEIVSNGLLRQLKAYTGHYRNLLRRKDFGLLFAQKRWAKAIMWGARNDKREIQEKSAKEWIRCTRPTPHPRRQTTFVCTYVHRVPAFLAVAPFFFIRLAFAAVQYSSNMKYLR